jgi:AraC-like DNA-binding protein
VLSIRRLLDRDGVRVSDVACHHPCGLGRPAEQTAGHAIVFVRRGRFRRSADGVVSVLDATFAYSMNPGEEERYDHLDGCGDDCTWLSLDPEASAALAGGDPELPPRAIPTAAWLDLEHRRLLAAGRRGADSHELYERALLLAARVLGQTDPRRVEAGRPATARARRALADGTREALAADPGRPLPVLARDLAVSPHHLSRVFHAGTGHTIARHRIRLRARAALERLAGGEGDLAGLAAELGFADQSHLARVLRRETGRTPSALRRVL